MLYPLSYEGVPIQYKAPRTASPHSPPKPPASTGIRTVPTPCPMPCPNPYSPPCVHRLSTPAPGGRTAPTMYE